MSRSPDTLEREAVTRLFELSQSGDTDNSEFAQLASAVYESMFENYNASRDAAPGESIS
ncbi:hypothetical protein BH23PSE2_BH23PSE2_02520 [soil metagenome]